MFRAYLGIVLSSLSVVRAPVLGVSRLLHMHHATLTGGSICAFSNTDRRVG